MYKTVADCHEMEQEISCHCHCHKQARQRCHKLVQDNAEVDLKAMTIDGWVFKLVVNRIAESCMASESAIWQTSQQAMRCV